MSSQAQINANCQNAQKSTGPRTAGGKATASQNAIKHGLSAKYDVISSESQADYDLYRQRILDELCPQGPTESMLAERIVSLHWRLERTVRIQNQVFDAMIFKTDNPSPITKLAESIIPAHLKQNQPDPSPDIKMGQMVIKDFANSRVLDRLLMYERRMENSLYKTMLELQRLRLARDLDTIASMDKQTESQLPDPRPLSHFSFLQNEPNFKSTKTNSNTYEKRTYDKLTITDCHKNEPKRTQKLVPSSACPEQSRTDRGISHPPQAVSTILPFAF